MALIGMEHDNGKIPIKRIRHNLGNVSIGTNGVSSSNAMQSIAGYTPISANIYDISNAGGQGVGLIMYGTTSLYITGKASTSITGVKVDVIYVSDEWFDIASS